MPLDTTLSALIVANVSCNVIRILTRGKYIILLLSCSVKYSQAFSHPLRLQAPFICQQSYGWSNPYFVAAFIHFKDMLENILLILILNLGYNGSFTNFFLTKKTTKLVCTKILDHFDRVESDTLILCVGGWKSRKNILGQKLTQKETF